MWRYIRSFRVNPFTNNSKYPVFSHYLKHVWIWLLGTFYQCVIFHFPSVFLCCFIRCHVSGIMTRLYLFSFWDLAGSDICKVVWPMCQLLNSNFDMKCTFTHYSKYLRCVWTLIEEAILWDLHTFFMCLLYHFEVSTLNI